MSGDPVAVGATAVTAASPIIALGRKGHYVQQVFRRMGVKLGLVFLGLFGVAFAITGLLVALPVPAIGGTCGPTKASESALAAFFNPGSIGAGVEPAVTKATDHAQWLAFVGECQAATNSRVLATFAILVLSLAVAGIGTVLMRRRFQKKGPEVQVLAQ